MIRMLRPSASGKVVRLNRFRSNANLSPIRQAEAYWSALRADQDIPFRSQIDPRGIDQILEYSFILERVAPGVGRFRLAGQHICKLAGMEVRGMPISALFSAPGREGMSAVLEYIFDTPAVAELELQGSTGMMTPDCNAGMVLLPLKSDQGKCDRLWGVLVADPMSERTVQHFDIIDSKFRDVEMPDVARQTTREAVQGFAESQAVLGGRAPWLRLVKSDE